MAEEEHTEAPGGGKKSLLADWKGMKGWQKAGVLIAGGGLLIAILIYMKNQQNPQATGNSSGFGNAATEASQYPGSGDIYPSMPTSSGTGAASVPPTTSGTATPPAEYATPVLGNGGAAFSQTFSGTNANGLLGAGATIQQRSGGLFAEQPGGSWVNLNSLLPSGTEVYKGKQGRYWYENAGSNTQYLLTSGSGGSVRSGIGATVKTPKGAYRV